MTNPMLGDPMDDRIASLERRLEEMEGRVGDAEDRLAIYHLVASYGPAADGLSRAGLEELWVPDGTYDTEYLVFEGAAAVGGIVDDSLHHEFIAAGCAHIMSMPHISLTGDTAVATNYSRVYIAGEDGWRVVRAAANRWELIRGSDGVWRVQRRVNRLLNGSEASRSILAKGVNVGR